MVAGLGGGDEGGGFEGFELLGVGGAASARRARIQSASCGSEALVPSAW